MAQRSISTGGPKRAQTPYKDPSSNPFDPINEFESPDLAGRRTILDQSYTAGVPPQGRMSDL